MSPRTLLVSLASCLLIGCASSKPTHELRVIRSPSGAVAVPVELDDYAIRMPDPIPSGAVTFDVKNLGDHTHTIRVTGNGVGVGSMATSQGKGGVVVAEVAREPTPAPFPKKTSPSWKPACTG